MNHLPYDCARCHGVIFIREGHSVCESRETCRRYLSREHAGDRTPFLIMPLLETSEKCDDYWEDKE